MWCCAITRVHFICVNLLLVTSQNFQEHKSIDTSNWHFSVVEVGSAFFQNSVAFPGVMQWNTTWLVFISRFIVHAALQPSELRSSPKRSSVLYEALEIQPILLFVQTVCLNETIQEMIHPLSPCAEVWHVFWIKYFVKFCWCFQLNPIC